MKPPSFLKNKISRLLRTSGIEYEFSLHTLDEYNQPVKAESTVKVLGVYHEKSSEADAVSDTEAASSIRSKVPMILTLLDENSSKIKQNDYLSIDGTEFRVLAIEDVQMYHIAVEIYLREVVHEQE